MRPVAAIQSRWSPAGATTPRSWCRETDGTGEITTEGHDSRTPVGDHGSWVTAQGLVDIAYGTNVATWSRAGSRRQPAQRDRYEGPDQSFEVYLIGNGGCSRPSKLTKKTVAV